MARPQWFPIIQPGTSPENRQAIRECQGDWWLWGGSICKKPEACVSELSCYFVRTAARHKDQSVGSIPWVSGFDEREAA